MRHGEMNGPSKWMPARSALLDELGQQRRALGQHVHLTGDRRRDDGGRAVLAVGADTGEDLVRRSRREGSPAAAVVVDVDETGDDRMTAEVEVEGVGGAVGQGGGG
ncbi:hypothetical protein M2266_003125 [Streptomyces sp. SPB162]|nr:hypothetical protein [Streptomyces sp. SPB162]